MKIKILWVDDEIDLLKPHILFLEKKNYEVRTASNGQDALDIFKEESFDVVFLDENMPGLSGLETLSEMKIIKASVPMIMITKSEEEYIMDEAIGSQIADYLIKPVNPNQILLSLKKNLDHLRLISEKTKLDYQKEFRNISMELMSVNSYEGWEDIYKKIIYWELELEKVNDTQLINILETQKIDANTQFCKFVEKNYENWLNNPGSAPLFSHQLFKQKVAPMLRGGEKVFFLVIDNLRYDQWKAVEHIIANHYKVETDESYFSILPTATQYSRNAIFSGMTPLEMEQHYPKYWKNDTAEGGKNLFEAEFLNEQLKYLGLNSIKHNYAKITSLKSGKSFINGFNHYKNNQFIALVYNFVDMLSHKKTEMEVIKELASDDKAYRMLTQSWFANSPLLDIIKLAQRNNFKLVITTDHGTINCKNATKVVGNKETSLNLRYKTGRSLSHNEKDVYAVKDPKKIQLPSINLSSSYIFAKNDYFLAYANNFNHYASYYKNTYQHGGISLQEMVIPFIVLNPKE